MIIFTPRRLNIVGQKTTLHSLGVEAANELLPRLIQFHKLMRPLLNLLNTWSLFLASTFSNLYSGLIS